MKVKVVHDGRFLPRQVREVATQIVGDSLRQIVTRGDQFVINDTLYFRAQRTGRVTTCVMNSASFLSKSFQRNLAGYPGCNGETKIDGQNIDGTITLTVETTGYRIKDPNELLRVLHRYIEQEGLQRSAVYTLFPMFYGMYTGPGLYDIERLPADMHGLFEEVPGVKQFRIGVEFETGNVASSFRAFNKLFVLFQNNYIDAGVFVTSLDKRHCATRIWPVANRNGSFQELEQRRYLEQVSLPLLCVGFQPDSFDSNAPFLGKNGGLFTPEPTGRTDSTGAHQIYLGEDGEEILKPVGF